MKLEKKQKIYNFLISWAAFCPDFPDILLVYRAFKECPDVVPFTIQVKPGPQRKTE